MDPFGPTVAHLGEPASSAPPDPSSQQPITQSPPEKVIKNGAKQTRPPRAEKNEPYVRPQVEKRQQLSPEELTTKMEAMKLRNQELAALREAALADENEYAESEKQANKVRKRQEEEAKARKEAQSAIQQSIDSDRASAAARKLAKMQGRDWDAQKEDEKTWDPAKSRSADRPHGNGEDGDDDLSYYYYRNPNTQSPRARGRGGRGSNGSVPRATRGRGLAARPVSTRAVDTASKTDFPDLPANAQSTGTVSKQEAKPSPSKLAASVKAKEFTPASKLITASAADTPSHTQKTDINSAPPLANGTITPKV